MRNKRLKGFYIVSEGGCLDPKSGAARHIYVGLRELSKHFDVVPILPEPPPQLEGAAPREWVDAKSPFFLRLLVGALRDGKEFLRKALHTARLIPKIRSEQPGFVYYRMCFLDPLPLVLRLLGIPCFIEANGIQFEAREKYYPSLAKPINRVVERFTYSMAAHVFFVGSYGDYWRLDRKNWSNTENGVEREFFVTAQALEKKVGKTLHLAFVGRLMPHHRPEILVAAVKKIEPLYRDNFCLHLIGSGFETLKRNLDGLIDVTDHGFLDREALMECLPKIHVGIVTGGPPYASQMKLLDYGAAKCCVVAPSTYNLRYWFDQKEIEFFEVESASSLAAVLTSIARDPSIALKKGERLHERLSVEFSWEVIFSAKAEKMALILGSR
jgi:glycosyltransferase involved in cell wall biosynthesis